MFNSFIFFKFQVDTSSISPFPIVTLYIRKTKLLIKNAKKERKNNDHTHLSKTDTSQDVNDLNVWGRY